MPAMLPIATANPSSSLGLRFRNAAACRVAGAIARDGDGPALRRAPEDEPRPDFALSSANRLFEGIAVLALMSAPSGFR